jgi:hypothetical protein
MTAVATRIQQLIAEGDTENALNELNQWVKNQHQHDWIRQCVLVQGRWEQLQRDMVAGVVDADDARQETNQINFAILQLLDYQPPVKTVSPSRNFYLIYLPIIALILLGAWVLWEQLKPVQDATHTPAAATTTSGNKSVKWPKGSKTNLAVNSAVYTFDVLKSRLEDFNSEQNRLVIQMRCTSTYDYDTNFWDDSFRLESEDVPPIVASGGLNEIVSGNSFKDGELVFLLPKSIQKGILKISIKGEKTTLPVEF